MFMTIFPALGGGASIFFFKIGSNVDFVGWILGSIRANLDRINKFFSSTAIFIPSIFMLIKVSPCLVV